MEDNITLNDIVEYEGVLYRVIGKTCLTPGRRMAITHLTLSSLIGSKKLERKIDQVSKVELESKELQFVRNSTENLYEFLDLNSCEMIEIHKSKIDKPELLQENMIIRTFSTEEYGIVKAELPRVIEANVVQAGEAESGKNKTVILHIKTEKYPEGLAIQAPSYIKRGDVVSFEKDTLEFKQRVQQSKA